MTEEQIRAYGAQREKLGEAKGLAEAAELAARIAEALRAEGADDAPSMNRRAFLLGLGAALVAPVPGRRVYSFPTPTIWTPPDPLAGYADYGAQIAFKNDEALVLVVDYIELSAGPGPFSFVDVADLYIDPPTGLLQHV